MSNYLLFMKVCTVCWVTHSLEGSVIVACGLQAAWLRKCGSNSGTGTNFVVSTTSRLCLKTSHLHVHVVHEVKWLWQEHNHSCLSSDKMNVWTHTPPPHMTSMYGTWLCRRKALYCKCYHINPYPTAFPYGNGMVLHFYQQQESSTTKTVHKVINKGLKTYV